MTEETAYHYYDKLIKKLDREDLTYGKDYLENETFFEIKKVRDRLIEIYSEIRDDYTISLDDPQYESTVGWGYEKEIKELKQKHENLKEKFENECIVLEKLEHEKMLKEIGMTEEQYREATSYRKKKKLI